VRKSSHLPLADGENPAIGSRKARGSILLAMSVKKGGRRRERGWKRKQNSKKQMTIRMTGLGTQGTSGIEAQIHLHTAERGRDPHPG
jgi:hypothetical protein